MEASSNVCNIQDMYTRRPDAACSVCNGTKMLLNDECPLCDSPCMQELTIAGLAGDVQLVLQKPKAELRILDLKQQLAMQALEQDRIVCFEILHENTILGDALSIGELSLPPVATLQVIITMPRMEDVEAMLSDGQRRFAAAKTLMSFGDAEQRRKAVDAFGEIGAPAVVHVVGALGDDSSTVRSAALKLLIHAPGLAASHTAEIVQLLRDSDRSLRKLVSKHFKEIVFPSVIHTQDLLGSTCDSTADACVSATKAADLMCFPSAPQITQMLQDEDDTVRKGAAEAVGKLGVLAAMHMDEIVALLSDRSANVRQHAIEALGNTGSLAAARLQKITSLLQDTDPGVRGAAAETLGKIGVLASPSAGHLLPLLSDSDPHVRRSTCHAFGRIGLLAARFAPQLAACLRDPDDGVRGRAVQAMGKFGKLAFSHASVIEQMLKDRDENVRRLAAEALGRTTVQYEEHAASLAEALRTDVDQVVRKQAAVSLGFLGAHAIPHLGVLIGALANSDSSVQCAVASAIGELAPHVTHVPDDLCDSLSHHLLHMLGSSKGGTQQQAAESLSKLHGLQRSAGRDQLVFGLVSLLQQSEDRAVRSHAVEALGKSGRRAWRSTEAVVDRLRDTDHAVREKAAKALSKLSRRQVEHAEPLAELLHDAGHKVRSEAAGSLGKMFGANAGHHQAAHFGACLAACLNDSSFEVRLQAMESLGKFGRRAAIHVNDLEAALSCEQDLIVRESAEKALKSMRSS